MLAEPGPPDAAASAPPDRPLGTRPAAALAEAALLVVVVGTATALRLVHLDTPSLWWDELVEIRTAQQPLAALLRTVRYGVAPGGGTAGAMPAAYVVLHAFLGVVPPPAPERLEAYFRAPACAASIAAVVALYGLARATFGRATAAVAAWLLATSLPAILYAAETRAYSLLTLATVAVAAAFAALVRAPDRGRRWALHAVACVLAFAAGVFSLLLVAAQYAILGVLALRRGGPRLGALLGAALVVAAIALGYLAGTPFGATYPRHVAVEPMGVTRAAVDFFAAGHPALVVGFVAGIPLALRAGMRRGHGAFACFAVSSFAALPVMAVAIASKSYYFHPRHALFLLPLFDLVAAAGLVEGLRAADPLRRLVAAPARRRAAEATLAIALVTVVVAPQLRAFVADPRPAFAATKTLRDVDRVTRDVAERVGALPAGARYVVLAERESTANALLSAYLDWYGLRGRVTLRSPGVPLDQIAPLLHRHGGDPAPLRLRPAVGLVPPFRRFLGLDQPLGDVPPRIDRFAIVAYGTPLSGPDVHRYTGVAFQPAG